MKKSEYLLHFVHENLELIFREYKRNSLSQENTIVKYEGLNNIPVIKPTENSHQFPQTILLEIGVFKTEIQFRNFIENQLLTIK